MKQTTTEVITKLTIEYNDLAGRIGSLERFLICEDFQKVSSSQKALLARQRDAMDEYKEILVSRLIELRHQEEREKYIIPREPAPEVINCASCRHYQKVTCNHGALKNENCWEAKDGTPAD